MSDPAPIPATPSKPEDNVGRHIGLLYHEVFSSGITGGTLGDKAARYLDSRPQWVSSLSDDERMAMIERLKKMSRVPRANDPAAAVAATLAAGLEGKSAGRNAGKGLFHSLLRATRLPRRQPN